MTTLDELVENYAYSFCFCTGSTCSGCAPNTIKIFKAGYTACQAEMEKLRAENAELKGALDLKNDEYVKVVGTWRIINRLEEREKLLEAEIDNLRAEIVKLLERAI